MDTMNHRKKWPIDKYCERCKLSDRMQPVDAQKFGYGTYLLTCSLGPPHCDWSMVSYADWSLGSSDALDTTT